MYFLSDPFFLSFPCPCHYLIFLSFVFFSHFYFFFSCSILMYFFMIYPECTGRYYLPLNVQGRPVRGAGKGIIVAPVEPPPRAVCGDLLAYMYVNVLCICLHAWLCVCVYDSICLSFYDCSCMSQSTYMCMFIIVSYTHHANTVNKLMQITTR